METLFQKLPVSIDNFMFNHVMPVLLEQENANSACKLNHGFNKVVDAVPPTLSSVSDLVISDESSQEADASEEGDPSGTILKFISDMLMEEEDLEYKPCMFHDCSALQAAEKSFYDVLGQKYPPSPHSPDGSFETRSSQSSNSCVTESNNFLVTSNYVVDQAEFESILSTSSPVESVLPANYELVNTANTFMVSANWFEDSSLSQIEFLYSSSSSSKAKFDLPSSGGSKGEVTHSLPNIDYFINVLNSNEKSVAQLEANDDKRDHSPDASKGKKNHYREESNYVDESRSNKQFASYLEEYESEMFDEVLLCPTLNHCDDKLLDEAESSASGNGCSRNNLEQNEQPKRSNRGRPRGKKQGIISKEVVDLRSLLTQCAQAVASYDSKTAEELLKRIRKHSSPHGDGTERLAHYFANALEARLAGTGTALYAAIASAKMSAAEILKAYQVYISASPFKIMSNIFANKSIKKIAKHATRLHIIDFGILYGFQWPCLIKSLSETAGGPPKLRITGIDLPQPGFRPAERVQETGHRLENYCKRFNVPFEYNAIAKKWDTIQLEDLKIEKDEVLIVNCLYRLGNVPDETVVASSPRDAVLNLIRRINPNLFIHGVINGTFNAPFFATRFREALFHFSALFDMFEATTSREDQNRMLFEKGVFGRDAMNVLACEGTERIERPETYKQWQVRHMKAGFKQLPLDSEIVKFVRNKVKSGYHKDFVVDEDGHWMLQGWKGRVIHALSCWKPAH